MPIEVWWAFLTVADRSLLDLVSAAERERVVSLDRQADKGRSLLGAALLRVAVAAHLRVDPREVVVERTCTDCGAPHGPPRIMATGSTRPWVSVSHSGALVVVALNPDGPVGVDVQRLSELNERGMRGGDAARQWVIREALLKAGWAPTCRGDNPGLPPARTEVDWSVNDLRAPLPAYVAALAVPARTDVRPRVRIWRNLDEIRMPDAPTQ